jgi:hypothetical protein
LGGLGVINKEDYAPCGRVILFGELNTEKAFHAFAWLGLFYLFQASGKPGFVSNKKALPFHGKTFSV